MALHLSKMCLARLRTKKLGCGCLPNLNKANAASRDKFTRITKVSIGNRPLQRRSRLPRQLYRTNF